jgi:hypothetical protein
MMPNGSRPPPDTSTTGVKVLYIGGLGRSGSTLLDRMLGQIPGFFSAGEIRDLWNRGIQENLLCGCGIAFADCPFWSAVGQEAYGGWDRIDAQEVIQLKDSVDRHSKLPLLMAPSMWPPFRRRLRQYLEIITPLYRAIHTVGDTKFIIDSSKAPSTAFVLRRMPDLDLRIVHLVRDSRGVAFSWNKKVRRPDAVNKEMYMHRYPPFRIGLRWLTRNAQMELLGKLGIPRILVRYEAMIEDPRAQLMRILEASGEPVSPSDLAFISDGAVDLQPNHTVMGNPVRMHIGRLPLQLDDKWRVSMDRKQTGIVTMLTKPVLHRYGYQP